jgi:nicotinamide-nucleotide amidase
VSDTTSATAELTAVSESISRALRRAKQTVSVAESLTSGRLAGHLGAAPSASEWFCGGVIAYASQVKFTVLGVEPGPVITASCARQMARGVAELTGSDLAVAVTGVGGPDPVEGHPPGTVFVAVRGPATDRVEEFQFPGDVDTVVQATAMQALKMLADEADR